MTSYDVIGRDEYIIFTFSESSNPWVYSLQFLFKSTNNSWRYERKCEWVFFSEHSVYSASRRKTSSLTCGCSLRCPSQQCVTVGLIDAGRDESVHEGCNRLRVLRGSEHVEVAATDKIRPSRRACPDSRSDDSVTPSTLTSLDYLATNSRLSGQRDRKPDIRRPRGLRAKSSARNVRLFR